MYSSIVGIASFIDAKVAIKNHLAEPVITVIIQDRLSNIEGLVLARLLVSSTHFKVFTIYLPSIPLS